MTPRRPLDLPTRFVLRQAQVLNEVGDFAGPLDICVDQGIVQSIGPDLKCEARSYDFHGLWVMPGMVDCHFHAIATSLDTMELLRTPLSQRILEAASILRRTLEAGVTTARDAGGIDPGVREAVARRYVPGPRLQVAYCPLSQTGGHFDGYLCGLEVAMATGHQIPNIPGRPPVVADGPEELRKAVRLLARAGADWIKLCTTGGIMSGTGPAAQFDSDEIAAAVSAARRHGKPVMVHCYGGTALRDSVAAGVRSVEHGVFLSEEDARLMAENRCWLVPTLTILRDIQEWAQAGRLSTAASASVAQAMDRFGDAVNVARAAGVQIALGTDFISREQHGGNLREIAAARDAGLTVSEALLAATRNGAELLGVGDRVGRIAAGYWFDAIVLDDDPGDLAFARHGRVDGVFKAGESIVHHPRLDLPVGPPLGR
jgi:imidazolonepropionase-like amidohydrolase